MMDPTKQKHQHLTKEQSSIYFMSHLHDCQQLVQKTHKQKTHRYLGQKNK